MADPSSSLYNFDIMPEFSLSLCPYGEHYYEFVHNFCVYNYVDAHALIYRTIGS